MDMVPDSVAPLAGSVDRNIGFLKERKYIYRVAPLAGSVDRNQLILAVQNFRHVAPLAGSVDRNCLMAIGKASNFSSLPSRGAWIEISDTMAWTISRSLSLPSRGAWIEIIIGRRDGKDAGSRSPRGERG